MIFEFSIMVFFVTGIIMAYLSDKLELDELNTISWVMIIFGGFILLIGIGTGIQDRYEGDKETFIYSLNREGGVYGHFSLGSGEVESSPVYYAYTKTDDGGYSLLTIKQKSPFYVETILYEKNETPRYIIKTTCKRKTNWINWYGECSTKSMLIVPENTIIEEFKG